MNNEDPFRTSIAIVMPASHYGSNPMSHCTAMFLGMTDEVDYTQRQMQRIVDRLARMDMWHLGRLDVQATGFDHFGVEHDIPVALINDERLYRQREELEEILRSYEIDWNTMFDYNPHISLKPDERIKSYPNYMRVCLRPPVLWWGNDRPNLPRFLNEPFHV
jgi:2'-5' RNA ligase